MRHLIGILALIGLMGATAADADQNDPYEPTNRAVFEFNQQLDHHVARPVAVFYNHAVPQFARDGVHNFVTNIEKPVTLAGDALQGKSHRAGETFARFVVNSTIGIAGLVDVDCMVGISDHSEDCGQTLAVYGS